MSDAFETGLSGRESEFGKTWISFLAALTVPQIYHAERSLAARLHMDRLDRKTFLDIGSGSGLLSLAARRRGAKVFSFDSDPQAVACARELRRRYFPDDADWHIETGSVLDQDYLKSLGTFDIVFAENVLNHTGAMMQALENVKSLVAVGGQLQVSIYNDYQEVSNRWDRLKRTYRRLPRPAGFVFGLGLIARSEARSAVAHWRQRSLRHWLRSWIAYHDGTPGISRWHDWKGWLDAHPYERATVDDIVELYGRDGFRLISTSPPRTIFDCASFVFHRDQPSGLAVNQYARRRGPRQLNPDAVYQRVTPPWTLTESGWFGTIVASADFAADAEVSLFRDGELAGPTTVDGERALVAMQDESEAAIAQADFYVFAGETRPLFPPFRHERGQMWSTTAHDLSHIADDLAHGTRSPVLLFENGHQLRKPHTPHNEIDHRGGGNFSHWESTIYFSSSDGSDPNFNGYSYSILIGGARKKNAPKAASKPERGANGEFIVTPEMISAGISVLEDWERTQGSSPVSGAAKITFVSALYRAMRMQS
jgi:2-polyprenyl-6-hydroxyphenyl methylase/3-demethylubiquinone-9 3-methyltransferase